MRAIIVIFLLSSCVTNAQPSVAPRDTTTLKDQMLNNLKTMNERKRQIKSLIVPAALITYGLVSLDNENLQALDRSIKDEIRENNSGFHTNVDNYLQYAPAIAVYGLNAMGIKGKNNFLDRTMIYLLSNCLLGITVQPLKAITKVQRPDGFAQTPFLQDIQPQHLWLRNSYTRNIRTFRLGTESVDTLPQQRQES